MANNYNGVLRAPVIFCRDGEARWSSGARRFQDLTVPVDVDGSGWPTRRCMHSLRKIRMNAFGLGLLGPARSAPPSRELLAERAEQIAG